MRPALVFFNEQPASALDDTFTPEVLGHLQALRASVSMAMLDRSERRAEVIERLTRAGVPVHAWLLVPREAGYFASHGNAPEVARAFDAFLAFRDAHRLDVSTVGLDFEPDVRDLDALLAAPLRTVARRLSSLAPRHAVDAAVSAYRALVARMRARGFVVETYQVPLVVDDRRAGSRFFQRAFGLLDVEADRQVLMAYSSLMGPLGPSLLEAWAPGARAIGVGSTGGGIDPLPKLTPSQLERDLRAAARHAREVYVFSLEGCVAQRATAALCAMDWAHPAPPPWRRRLAAATASAVLGALARLDARDHPGSDD
ncbi:MAG: hypothetical protein INH41_19110 [Myxococcaceae bacterium]|jgi:hypothetical protein|nr:hypothetical protein [Myxococcaceae bacterium]MCA3014496.1 hypothetical protein [Myxococcaceae bacterium]